MEKLEELKEILEGVDLDVGKFEQGNNSAGGRIRKAMCLPKRLELMFRPFGTDVAQPNGDL